MTERGVAAPEPGAGRLRRELGVFGATMLGLGSILGTGIFVSVGVAAGATGPSVVLAIALAAGLAACNALSSAQLAASHPVSGGTYEYGYRWLSPALGFGAGWCFLLAKSASAATAALGFAGYLSHLLGFQADRWLPAVALAGVALLTAVVAGGIRRSHVTNLAVVGLTLAALLAFVAAGAREAVSGAGERFLPFFTGGESGRGDRGPGRHGQRRDDLVVQRLHGAPLLRDHEPGRPGAPGGGAALPPGRGVDGARRLPLPRLLGGPARVARRAGAPGGRAPLARVAAADGAGRLRTGHALDIHEHAVHVLAV